MKRNRVYFIFFILVVSFSSLHIVSCSNMGTLFDSKTSIINQLKQGASQHEQLIEKNMFVHEAITFDLNKANLSSKAKALLKNKVKWLIKHPNVNAIIEGHCDHLGSIEYNNTLGKKRAIAVKAFMIDNGIDESRISLISLGKDKPVNAGKTNEELVKNRRVVFKIAD